MTQTQKGMNAWTNDAAGIDIGSLKETPYCHESLADFFSARIGDPEKILVAPKGYGKTLYLKYKAYVVRLHSKGSLPIFPDASSDVEFLKLSVDWRELYQKVARLNEDQWALLWQFVLLLKGLQLVSPTRGIEGYLENILRNPRIPIGDLLGAVIRDADNFDTALSQRLATVRNAFNESDVGAVIFIDNIDEMFVGMDQDIILSPVKEKKALTKLAFPQPKSPFENMVASTIEAEATRTNPGMWKAAQVGLLLAIREIERSARKLSVYSSLRAEAVYATEHPIALQARSHVIPIRYSREDLLSIFEWHINLMPPGRLAEPNADLIRHRLVGRAPLAHSYVKHSGNPVTEDLFDLLIRHTTFCPRELVVLGGAVARLGTHERLGADRDRLIRDAVTQAVSMLFTSYKNNCVPRWKFGIEDSLRFTTAPTLDRARAERLPQDAARYFYSHGLLGVAESTGNHERFRQKFLTPWDHSFASLSAPLPNSEYYFLHPWLCDGARDFNPRFQRDLRNIIGHGCEYQQPPPASITVARDANNRLSLWVDGSLDGHATSSDTLTMPVAFLHVALLAVQESQSTRITRQQFDAANSLLSQRFPVHAGSIPLNPFENPDHRAHLRKHLIASFPRLATYLAAIQEPFAFVQAKFSANSSMELTFLELTSFRYEAQ